MAINSHLHKTSTISSYQNSSISAGRQEELIVLSGLQRTRKKRKNEKNMKMGGRLSDFSTMIRYL